MLVSTTCSYHTYNIDFRIIYIPSPSEQPLHKCNMTQNLISFLRKLSTEILRTTFLGKSRKNGLIETQAYAHPPRARVTKTHPSRLTAAYTLPEVWETVSEVANA